MVLIVLSILGISILMTTMNFVKVSTGERDDQSVFYIAEAGLVERREQLNNEVNNALIKALPIIAENEKKEPQNRKNPEDIYYATVEASVNTGEFAVGGFEAHFNESDLSAQVTVTGDGKNYTIRSTGYIGKKKRTVKQNIRIIFDPNSIPKSNNDNSNNSPLNSCYALYTNSAINISNGTINGDIYSTDKIKVSGGPKLNGSIYSSEEIEITGGSGIKNVYSMKDIKISSGEVSGSLLSNTNILVNGYPTVGGNIVAKNNINVNGWFNGLAGKYQYGGTINFQAEGNKNNQIAKLQPSNPAEISTIIQDFIGSSNSGGTINDCASQVPKLENEAVAFRVPTGIPMPDDKTIPGYNSSEIVNVIKNGSLNMTHELTNKMTLELDSDLYFKNIEITTSKKLYIDLKGSTRTIYVDSFNVPNGHIELVNPGKLNIQVLDKMNFGAGSSITNVEGDDAINTKIYYAGNQSLTIDGGVDLWSSLHIKDANLTITAGGGVHGDVYVYGNNSITVSGGSSVVEQLFLAPNSSFIQSGGGTINGNVVAKNYHLEGGATINPPRKSNIPTYPAEPDDKYEGNYDLLYYGPQIEE